MQEFIYSREGIREGKEDRDQYYGDRSTELTFAKCEVTVLKGPNSTLT